METNTLCQIIVMGCVRISEGLWLDINEIHDLALSKSLQCDALSKGFFAQNLVPTRHRRSGTQHSRLYVGPSSRITRHPYPPIPNS